jgi:hypothetical protein
MKCLNCRRNSAHKHICQNNNSKVTAVRRQVKGAVRFSTQIRRGKKKKEKQKEKE